MTRRDRWSAVLSVIALALLAIAVYTGIAPIDLRLGALRLRSAEPLRADILAAVCSLIALLSAGRSRRWRRLAALLLVVDGIAALAMLARGSPERWPTSDGAMIELFTVHATHGEQLLGAYSQFGWSHPGPMLFYWLAPFYVLGGKTVTSLAAPALVLNLLSVWACAWIAVRRASRVLVLPLALVSLAALLLYRLPGFVTSAWNPHIPFLPAMALLCLTAAVLDGDGPAFPLVGLFASFIAQAHVGLAPLGLAAGGVSVLAVAWHMYRERITRVRLLAWTAVTIVLVEIVWLLPVSQQLTARPGNMTKLYRFFLAGPVGDTPSVGAAWRIWGSTVAGILDPSFGLPIGHGISGDVAAWLPLMGTTMVLAMLPCAWLLGRRSSYARALALVAAGAAVLSFWSVLHVRGAVGDYHVFWIAGIGLVALAVCLGTAGVVALDRPDRSWVTTLAPYAAAGLTTVVVLQGAVPGILDRTDAGAIGDSERVRVITTGLLERLPALGVERPLVRVDDAVWAVGAGVILQLAKRGVPFAVEDPGLFGDALAPRGGEDGLVLISGPDRHLTQTLSAAVTPIVESEGVFADAVLSGRASSAVVP